MSSFFRDYFRKNSIAGPACYDERDSGSPDAGDPVEVDQGGRNRDLLQMRFVRMQGIIKEFRNRTRCQGRDAGPRAGNDRAAHKCRNWQTETGGFRIPDRIDQERGSQTDTGLPFLCSCGTGINLAPPC